MKRFRHNKGDNKGEDMDIESGTARGREREGSLLRLNNGSGGTGCHCPACETVPCAHRSRKDGSDTLF